jgi:site-specific DNA recombinase
MRERSGSRILRCAIYTRKSSAEGLEQDFNSLRAQREACEAYIASQKQEGWKPVPDTYDDGGFSGGSMERPALQALLADIGAGHIDVVVVYKVDRLTRSLTDFAKIVEVFDAHGVSFVSITQQFNTTSSMGRLTLNVLLSFAQFEREVTGERSRDKIAASEKKGLWMGGCAPIGYSAKDQTLVINEPEAAKVRKIFRLYLEHRCVRRVQVELDRLELTTGRYVAKTGRVSGGVSFSRGHLYRILSNPIYAGEIEHKGARHPGQHPAIVDRETWDAVQAMLKSNSQGHRTRSNAKESSLLAGLLVDKHGNRFMPTHAVKNGKRYRYYVLQPKSTSDEKESPLRVSAGEIEAVVISQVRGVLSDPERMLEALALRGAKPNILRDALSKARSLATTLEEASPQNRRAIIANIVARIVHADGLRILLDRHALAIRLIGSSRAGDEFYAIEAPLILMRRGAEMLLITKDDCNSGARPLDLPLLKALGRGHTWFAALASGRVKSVRELARQEGLTDRYISRQVAFGFMAPKLVEAILAQEQRFSNFCIEDLRDDQLPLSWHRQCDTTLGKADWHDTDCRGNVPQQQIPNLRVAGSNPERSVHIREVAGSIPAAPTIGRDHCHPTSASVIRTEGRAATSC